MATAAPPRIAAHGSSPEITRKLSEAFADAEVQQLREELGFGVPATAAGSTFAPEAFFGALDSRRAGHALLVAGDIASTQEFMRQHSSRLPDGALFVADRQTSGRGRGGNVWTSPAGCLMFTLCSHVAIDGSQAPFINYVACLAVTQALESLAASILPGLSLDVRIKWPNDIYHGGLKIGGALIHTTWQGGRFNVLTGVGLNVSNRQPTTCVDAILEAALSQAGRPDLFRPVQREALMAALCARFEHCFDTFQARGFAPLQQHYLSSWLHSGQAVEVEEDVVFANGNSNGNGNVGTMRARSRLVIAGLSPSGFLLAHDAEGDAYELTPDGNSLDMMAGLVRRKIAV